MRDDITRSFSAQEALSSRGCLPEGTRVGDHVISAIVARGGSGTVYRARPRAGGQDVAVKVLHASLAVQPKMVERFVREVTVVNLLKHPSIIQIHDVGSLPDGRPYYTMEWLSGQTLAAMLKERGRVSPAEALALLDPVCAALSAAHEAGVVHRDVKATNIMTMGGEPPVVKLLDFGIAKLVGQRAEGMGITSEGRQIGTLTIMAPEQFLGGPLDARTDVYALGVLLFRLVTGRLPFEGKSALAIAQQHLESPAPRPSDRTPLPVALDAIVLRAMEKSPDRRYPAVSDFLAALRSAVAMRPRLRSGQFLVPMLGLAVYVEIRVDPGCDDALDEELSDDIGVVLDAAEETLRASGYALALATGTQVLGVRALPLARSEAEAAKRAGVDLGRALRGMLDDRASADGRVHVNVAIHVDEIAMRDGEVTGGALLRLDRWAPRGREVALHVTPGASPQPT
jgi:eukaryotic-like serine/threonine-protein kinase